MYCGISIIETGPPAPEEMLVRPPSSSLENFLSGHKRPRPWNIIRSTTAEENDHDPNHTTAKPITPTQNSKKKLHSLSMVSSATARHSTISSPMGLMSESADRSSW